jgi:hypothetical protein
LEEVERMYVHPDLEEDRGSDHEEEEDGEEGGINKEKEQTC